MNTPSSMRTMLQEAGQRLSRVGIESPELNARMLLAHVLGLMEWELSFHYPPPTADQVERFQKLIDQRAQRIPLQHLVGWVGFYGLDLQSGVGNES